MVPTCIQIKDQEIPLVVRKSARARRISVRIAAAKNALVLTLPRQASVNAGLHFLHSKAAWILENMQAATAFKIQKGNTIPVLGKDYTLYHAEGRGVTHLDGERLIVYGASEFTARRVKTFLDTILLAHCAAKAVDMAQRIAKKPARIRLNEASSLWGSCTAKGALAFNRVLVFAPLPILDYIIAHEAAHLQEMNHSKKFWDIVRGIYPDMAQARKWLKQHGSTLHLYDGVISALSGQH